MKRIIFLVIMLASTAFGMEGFLKQSTAVNVTVSMTLSSDGQTGATGKTLTIYASKGAGTPALISPTVTELDSTNTKGLYKLALTGSHTDTLGELELHVTCSGCVDGDYKWEVSTYLPGEAVTVGTNNDKTGYSLTQSFPTNFSSLAIDGSGFVTFNNTSIGTVTNLTNLPSIPAGWLTATGIAAGALNGKGDWLLASSYIDIWNVTLPSTYTGQKAGFLLWKLGNRP